MHMLKTVVRKHALVYPAVTVSLMLFGFALQSYGLLSGCLGSIIPLVPAGFLGIIFSPFLHGNFEHLFGNIVPVAVLLFLLFQFYGIIAKKIFITGWFFTGLLVWLLPPVDIISGREVYTCTIGASGIVYMLAFYLFTSGVIRWDMKLLTISLLVALYYGSLIWGVFPEELFSNLNEPSKISWQSHLAGASVGVILAFMYKKTGERKRKFIWEYPQYYSEKDDKLWQEYREKNPNDFNELPQKKKDEIWEYLDELRRKKD